MSVGFTLLTIAEVLAGLLLIWGFWNEEKVCDFEDKILAKMGITRRKKRSAKITPFTSPDHPGRKKNCI